MRTKNKDHSPPRRDRLITSDPCLCSSRFKGNRTPRKKCSSTFYSQYLQFDFSRISITTPISKVITMRLTAYLLLHGLALTYSACSITATAGVSVPPLISHHPLAKAKHQKTRSSTTSPPQPSPIPHVNVRHLLRHHLQLLLPRRHREPDLPCLRLHRAPRHRRKVSAARHRWSPQFLVLRRSASFKTVL